MRRHLTADLWLVSVFVISSNQGRSYVEGAFAVHDLLDPLRQRVSRPIASCILCCRPLWSSRNEASAEGTVLDGPHRNTVSSNFWGSVVSKEEGASSNRPREHLPSVPTLDRDGPLPMGAYLTHGDPQYDPKETCCLAVAIDVPALRMPMSLNGGETSALSVAGRIHEFIDAGLTTFHLKASNQEQRAWAEETIIGCLQRETPSSVMKKCQFVVPMELQSFVKVNTISSSVRERALESLQRTGGDAIDCLQIQYNKESPYMFDVLENLDDLKRQGLIRSIGGRNVPPNILRQAREYGFSIDANQVDMNLLDPSAYSVEQTLACHDLGTPLFVSGALAGGFLTDRYVARRIIPHSWEFTLAERRHWNTDLDVWKERHGYAGASNDDAWKAYQSRILSELGTIALKHRVSVASVALRWSLQLDHVASAVVTCRMLYPDNGLRRKDRIQELRQVFRFELDEEDMQRLWDVSGQRQQEPSQVNLEEDEYMLDTGMMKKGSGLILPRCGDGSGRSKQLWL